MKILLTHRYFWPDSPPYASMLRTIAERLAADGHNVHVFASMPSYYEGSSDTPRAERLGAVTVRRVPVLPEGSRNLIVRVINTVIYCVALFVHILRTKPDVVTASSFPPVVAALAASSAARIVRARFVYHVQDVHPEASRVVGGLMGRTPIFQIFGWLDRTNLRRATRIITLSEDMAGTLRARGGDGLPIVVINNFLVETFEGEEPSPPESRAAPGRRRLLFAGNLGRFQNLHRLTEGAVMALERHPNAEIAFQGNGAAKADLISRYSDHPQIRFLPFVKSYPAARALISEADVAVVSLAKGMHRVVYPSKLLTYLGLGLPVLALVDSSSEMASEIAREGTGVIPEGESAEEIAAAIDLVLQPERLGEMRRAARAKAAQVQAPARLETWRELMRELAE